MAHPILMPKPGQMTEECTLVAWLKKEGDPVRKGDVLFEIETDKSNMDVEAFDDGVLLRRDVQEGETVPVNFVCAYVGDPGEKLPDKAVVAAVAPAPAPVAAAPAPAPVVAPAPAAPAAVSPAPTLAGARIRISPRASRLAAEAGIDPRSISGTGPEGRITERDVQSAISSAAMTPVATPTAAGAVAPVATAAVATPRPTSGSEWAGAADEEEVRPLSRMRRVIGERLTLSATTVPHFTVTVTVDMTKPLALRQELKAAGTPLSVTDFVLAATAQTLAEFPEVNSRTDGQQMWLRRRVHLGVAVSVPNGLVVPVLRDADRLSLTQIHDRAAALAEGARAGTLPVDDLTGSTFTVSNLGMFGVDEFTAIINPGEAAILAVSSVTPTVVVVGEGFGVRQIMKLTLSADHRLVDGELGARFLNALRRRLQDADSFRNQALNA
jgi:pyruvate dehydrogenase E2 component (dihydrolipoamide acetyltransferase)